MPRPLGYCVFLLVLCSFCNSAEQVDKPTLKQKAYDLFIHGYRSYMDYAFPADELMPISCKGRIRGITPSRGDVDDSLGNFSLTLIDTLDTLVVVGALDEFEQAVKLVIEKVRFDSDHVVSVFETNIRVLGGLLSGHLMAELVRSMHPGRLTWYNDQQLLKMAVDIGDRLLPAFNTTSGLPFSRINLRHGMLDFLKRQRDTCTACGGTMLLEMAALSRLTGNPVYEEKAKKAMDFLWAQRHRASDLMGTVLNVHSGDWVRRESGIGAGIDSYYEYCLKAYILLGDSSYLDRFNKHYDAIMRYVNKGPLFVDVHMHRPTVATRPFMDALLAFWPGLQVLKGDVKEAIEMHEMLFQVVKKHKFLPEAFTHDFQVHWAEHPLRPEFIESTYFLYRATKDPHYLKVAEQVMESIEKYVKVPCGFAGVKDVRTMSHEDRMDSFVLSETFKYLYMIFAEPSDLLFDPDNYVLTTEAHFLPLSIGSRATDELPRRMFIHPDDKATTTFISANPASSQSYPMKPEEASEIRERTKSVLEELLNLQNQQSASGQCAKPSERLRAWAFSASNSDHIRQLRDMGIDIQIHDDGRIYFSHQAANAKSNEYARQGVEFMQEMVQYSAQLEKEIATTDVTKNDRFVQILSQPFFGEPVIPACPAQYGPNMDEEPVQGMVAMVLPKRGCSRLINPEEVRGKIALIERSDCMFEEKTRFAQIAGAIGVIVYDHLQNSAFVGQPSFAMAGDKESRDDIKIPSVFVYRKEAEQLFAALKKDPKMIVSISSSIPVDSNAVIEWLLKTGKSPIPVNNLKCPIEDGDFVVINPKKLTVTFRFRFADVNQDSDPTDHQSIVERHVSELMDIVLFERSSHRSTFFNFLRTAAYGALDLNVQDEDIAAVEGAILNARITRMPPTVYRNFARDITEVRCQPVGTKMQCVKLAA